MKLTILFTFLLFTYSAHSAQWATNDAKDPAGTNAAFPKLEKPKLDKHENHCFNQLTKLDFIGKSYDIKKIAYKKVSDTEKVGYYEVREFKKQGEFKALARKRKYSCMYGLNYFDNNKSHKRKVLKINDLPVNAVKY